MKIKSLILILSLIYNITAQVIIKIPETEVPDGSFSTLNEFKKELEGVRIVSLGEGNHYMGTTFKTKVAMIKYLCDSLNFNVVAFESGLYDCKVTNDSLHAGTSSEKLYFDGLFGIWKCDEVKDLYEYLVKKNDGINNPIDLIGVDNQMLGNSKKYLANDFKLLFDSLAYYSSDSIGSNRFYSILQEGIRMSNYKQDFSVEDTTYFCAKLRKIKQVINENHLQTHPYYLFWEQLCTNIISDYTRMYFQPFGAIRDSMMFENLKWYLSQHPEKKIILWAASGHLMYEQHNENSNNKPMGNYLKSYYKDNYYAIVYTAYSGKFGNSDRGLLSFKIKKSTKSSIEYNIQKIYHGNFALFSLRNQENKKFIEQNKITKAKIGRNEITMIPFEFADALFYIKEMHAPTYFFNK